jgi:hypothetical protein
LLNHSTFLYSSFFWEGREKGERIASCCTAVQEPVLWAGVSDQWLSTTLDKNVALLIGLWQNTELGVCKKHLMYIKLLSFKKLYLSFSS